MVLCLPRSLHREQLGDHHRIRIVRASGTAQGIHGAGDQMTSLEFLLGQTQLAYARDFRLRHVKSACVVNPS